MRKRAIPTFQLPDDGAALTEKEYNAILSFDDAILKANAKQLIWYANLLLDNVNAEKMAQYFTGAPEVCQQEIFQLRWVVALSQRLQASVLQKSAQEKAAAVVDAEHAIFASDFNGLWEWHKGNQLKPFIFPQFTYFLDWIDEFSLQENATVLSCLNTRNETWPVFLAWVLKGASTLYLDAQFFKTLPAVIKTMQAHGLNAACCNQLLDCAIACLANSEQHMSDVDNFLIEDYAVACQTIEGRHASEKVALQQRYLQSLDAAPWRLFARQDSFQRLAEGCLLEGVFLEHICCCLSACFDKSDSVDDFLKRMPNTKRIAKNVLLVLYGIHRAMDREVISSHRSGYLGNWISLFWQQLFLHVQKERSKSGGAFQFVREVSGALEKISYDPLYFSSIIVGKIDVMVKNFYEDITTKKPEWVIKNWRAYLKCVLEALPLDIGKYVIILGLLTKYDAGATELITLITAKRDARADVISAYTSSNQGLFPPLPGRKPSFSRGPAMAMLARK